MVDTKIAMLWQLFSLARKGRNVRSESKYYMVSEVIVGAETGTIYSVLLMNDLVTGVGGSRRRQDGSNLRVFVPQMKITTFIHFLYNLCRHRLTAANIMHGHWRKSEDVMYRDPDIQALYTTGNEHIKRGPWASS